MSNSLRPHGVQHTRPPCPSPTPRVYSNSCPLSQWCHPTISSSVVPFSSHLQYFLASGSFQMSQFFKSGGQSIGVSASASVLSINFQDWLSLVWTGWLSLQSKGLSRVFSNITLQNHQFFGAQLSSQSNSHIYMRESVPRQVDKESRGPQGERGLEFSKRKKGQTFFLSPHSLGLYNNNVSCLRTVSGLNLLLS